MFFKSRPNLPPNEKAQVEYCFQWIADCLGPDRMKLPVRRSEEYLSDKTMKQTIGAIGDHLHYNVDELNILNEPQLQEKCGSGG
jgi:hypothetical protein